MNIDQAQEIYDNQLPKECPKYCECDIFAEIETNDEEE